MTRQETAFDPGVLNVLAETAYPLSTAAARVRIGSFVPFLRDHGVDLRLHTTLEDKEYSLVSSGASVARKSLALAVAAAREARRSRPPRDLLLIQRLRFLSPIPGLDPPRELDVYDFDDALFLPADGTGHPRYQWVKQEARRCVAYMRRAKLVIAGNSFLADAARQHAKRVEVVPSCVDPATQRRHVHEEAEELVVGWIGSNSTTSYLSAVFPAMERLNSGRARAKLVLVGAEPSVTAPWIEYRPWSAATQEGDLASFDVGVMPLPDSAWSRGKCGYKVLQYFAAGVPAVVSPVGVAPQLAGSDRGLVARTTEEWTAALEHLLEDVDERRERGEAARTFVERHYSYARWAPDLAELLRSVHAGRAADDCGRTQPPIPAKPSPSEVS